MNKKIIAFLMGISVAVVSVILVGCYYDLNGERHPTGPDRTGVQGWSLNVSITPATVPANGTSVMNVAARFWNLGDKSAVPNQEVLLTVHYADGSPANPQEVSFADGGITMQVPTNAAGIANATLYAHYIPKHLLETNYYIRAEATLDYDNNALYFWDIHYFSLYNPYYDGKPTPIPGDEDLPVAAFTFYPSNTTTCEVITFDASMSYDTDATGNPAYDQIVSYMWYFGDGKTGSGKVTSHKYDTDGDYTVDLVVYDDEGFSNTISDTVGIAGCSE
jgi:hypothetical protein